MKTLREKRFDLLIQNKTIQIEGGKISVEKAYKKLATEIYTGNDSEDRKHLQDVIDQNNLSAKILYKGNRVWGTKVIVKELKNILETNQLFISKTFKTFLETTCITLAYKNNFYINIKPKEIFTKKFIKEYKEKQPYWRTDTINLSNKMAAIISEFNCNNYDYSLKEQIKITL